jgi:hypothetical protein
MRRELEMSFIEEWRATLDNSYAEFVSLTFEATDIDLNYGILATAILWPIRGQLQNFDRGALDAVEEIVGVDDAKQIFRLVQEWDGEEPVPASNESARLARENKALKAALRSLIDYFGAWEHFRQSLAHGIAEMRGTGDVNLINDQIKAAMVSLGGVTETQRQELTIQLILEGSATTDEEGHTALSPEPAPPPSSGPKERSIPPPAPPTGESAPEAKRSVEDHGGPAKQVPDRPSDPTPAEESQTPSPEPAKRTVNLAFVDDRRPASPLSRKEPLAMNTTYFLRVSIGELEADSWTLDDTPFPAEHLPERSDGHLIKVVVFSDPGHFKPRPGQDIGWFRLPPRQPAWVEEPASLPGGDEKFGRAHSHLYFGLTTPARPGLAGVRLCFYFENNLVQSWSGTILVGDGSPQQAAQGFVVDYTLSHDLTAAQLDSLQPRSLNIMTNSTAEGQFALRIVGTSAKIDLLVEDLETIVEDFHWRLRKACWRGGEELSQDKEYLYSTMEPGESLEQANVGTIDGLAAALFDLAVHGWRFYARILETVPHADRAEFVESFRQPVTIQIARKQSSHRALPWAAIYDRPLVPTARKELCGQFLDAVRQARPLAAEPCFRGDCPNLIRPEDDSRTRQAKRNVVCPSGFWGFRHVICQPVSSEAVVTEIATNSRTHMVIGQSLDPLFEQREAHLAALGRLKRGGAELEFAVAPTPQDLEDLSAAEQRARAKQLLLDLMVASSPQLVYFYCHGGTAEFVLSQQGGVKELHATTPYIRVGPNRSEVIEPSDIPAWEFSWPNWHRSRPLVIINGCHTVGLTPKLALSFADQFVRIAGAAGVIGTEITIFEPLARNFAEPFLEAFLQGGPENSVGQLVKKFRLDLLQKLNPLGLVFTPYCYADLHLGQTG